MELPLVLGIASARDLTAAEPGLVEVFAGVIADVTRRFPGAPWRVLTARSSQVEEAAAGAAEMAGGRVDAPPEGRDASFIAEAAHLLVLLGRDAATEGAAERRLATAPPLADEGFRLDPPSRGPVVQIEREGGRWTASWREPEESRRRKGPKAHEKLWRRVEQFNRDAAATRVEPFLDAGTAASLAPGDRAVLAAYEAADAVATRYQRSAQRALGTLLAFAVAATVFLQLGALARLDRPVLGVLYVATLTAAWLVWLVSKRRDLRARHLDARALAEGLRVQLFWRLAGLGESASDHYLRKQRSELDWIRHALRDVDLGAGRSPGPPRPDLAQTHWLAPQARWFASNAKSFASDDTAVKRISSGLFGVALVLAYLKPFLNSAHPIVVLVGLCPLTAAFVKWWSERRAFGPLARQYERMAGLFDRASRLNARALEHRRGDESRTILLETGREALAENGDWVLLHRERPIRVPGT